MALKKKNTAEFVEKAKEVHNGKYTYELTEYVNFSTKLTITCPIHGNFEQWPGSHLNGSGCRQCSMVKMREVNSSKRNTNIFDDFREVHGDVYDYSKSEYKSLNSKIIIICPLHGEFMQTPKSHYYYQHGCPKCGKIKGKRSGAEKSKRSTDFFSCEPLNLKSGTCSIHGYYNIASSIEDRGCPSCSLNIPIFYVPVTCQSQQ